MRISSSTASTLAMPARKMAWLSARISLSMLSALRTFYCHPEAGAFCPPKDPREPREASRFLRRSTSAFGSLPFLRVPHELIRIDHAGHTLAVRAGTSRVGAHHAPLALNGDVLLPPGNVGWKRNLKLHRRTNLQRRVGANVHSRRAQISCKPLGVAARLLIVNLDRQFQRKSFSGPRFGHSAS